MILVATGVALFCGTGRGYSSNCCDLATFDFFLDRILVVRDGYAVLLCVWHGELTCSTVGQTRLLTGTMKITIWLFVTEILMPTFMRVGIDQHTPAAKVVT